MVSDVVAFDAESSGLDVRHDQALQWGLVTADENLVPTKETMLRVRRLPYVVPSPEALHVTGVDLASLDDPAHPDEYEAMGRVYKEMKTPWNRNRVFLGSNILKYDEQLLRHSLWRCLLDPYATSGKGASRVDLLSLVQVAKYGASGSIATILNEDGRPSFRLESLCQANGIPIQAHDALHDAKATLALAAQVRANARWVWDLAVAAGNPASVDALMAQAHRERRVMWMFSHFGEPDVMPCLPLGTDSRKRWIVADLRTNVDEIGETAKLSELAYGKTAAFRVVRAASAPYFVDVGTADRIAPGCVNAEVAVRADAVRANAELARRAVELLTAVEDWENHADATSEERIYAGFASNADKSAMTSFHAASWDDRVEIRFEDARLRDFAGRLIVMAERQGLVSSARVGDHWREASAAAFRRPFDDASSRWPTLAQVRSGPMPDAWRSWAEEAFSTSLDEPAPAVP